MFRGRGQNAAGIGIFLLAYQLLSVGFDNIPPVTLVTILAQAAIFLGLVPDLDSRKIYSLCLRPDKVWFGKEWWRLFPSTIMHASDMHLYFNMVSLLWKGRKLERKFGSIYFAYLLAVFATLTSVLMVAMSVVLEQKLGFREFGLMHQCAVGFSGVIFALKVLCNHYFPHDDSRLMGLFIVPSIWACWAELLLIYILVPNSSFVGHLAGILVGLAYVHGPLKEGMDIIISPDNERRRQTRQRGEDQYYSREYYNRPRPGRFSGSGTWGGAAQDTRGYATNHRRGFEDYTGGLSEDEQLRRAMNNSREGYGARFRQQPSAPPMYGWNTE